MNLFIKLLVLSSGLCGMFSGAVAADDLKVNGSVVWTAEQIESVLAKTIELRLAPDISHLSKRELLVIEELKRAGALIDELYIESKHKQALSIKADLMKLSDSQAQARLDLFNMFAGPIGTTLDNERTPFVMAAAEVAGKNFYPWGISKDEIERHFEKFPKSKAEILHPRTIVRRTTRSNLKRDLAVLKKHPVLDTLHFGLNEKLKRLNASSDRPGLYAIPYSVAYSEHIIKIYQHLLKASKHIKEVDSDFSDYLRNRARDLLSDDYEAGDASWIAGRFANINAQIGSYETYIDGLYGVKTAFSMNILIKDRKLSEKLKEGLSNLQEIENALPYEHHGTVKSEVPIGVYNVLADYGQSRGTNTASILPNEDYIVRKYGRIILMRYNILTNNELYTIANASWRAAVNDEFKPHLSIRSNYERTLWHEIGHYLGPSVDKQGRVLDVALEDNSNLLEEMKADLTSLFAHQLVHKKGRIDDDHLRMVYAGGVLRTLQKTKPRRNQAYQTMQLMTMNYFFEQGALTFDNAKGVLNIDYQRYPLAVETLLKKILNVQYQGDKVASDEFIEQYSKWDESLHGVLAKKMRDTNQPRYALVRYSALGE